MTRVGSLGVGWIGRPRMQATVETGAVDVAGIAHRLLEVAEVLDRICGR